MPVPMPATRCGGCIDEKPEAWCSRLLSINSRAEMKLDHLIIMIGVWWIITMRSPTTSSFVSVGLAVMCSCGEKTQPCFVVDASRACCFPPLSSVAD